jgi:hypothetical protein
MKKIKGPDIDSAAGEIYAGWGRSFYDHFYDSNLVGGVFLDLKFK